MQNIYRSRGPLQFGRMSIYPPTSKQSSFEKQFPTYLEDDWTSQPWVHKPSTSMNLWTFQQDIKSPEDMKSTLRLGGLPLLTTALHRQQRHPLNDLCTRFLFIFWVYVLYLMPICCLDKKAWNYSAAFCAHCRVPSSTQHYSTPPPAELPVLQLCLLCSCIVLVPLALSAHWRWEHCY